MDLSVRLDRVQTTYRSYFVQQGQAFALYGMELELVKLCSDPFKDLTGE